MARITIFLLAIFYLLNCNKAKGQPLFGGELESHLQPNNKYSYSMEEDAPRLKNSWSFFPLPSFSSIKNLFKVNDDVLNSLKKRVDSLEKAQTALLVELQRTKEEMKNHPCENPSEDISESVYFEEEIDVKSNGGTEKIVEKHTETETSSNMEQTEKPNSQEAPVEAVNQEIDQSVETTAQENEEDSKYSQEAITPAMTTDPIENPVVPEGVREWLTHGFEKPENAQEEERLDELRHGVFLTHDQSLEMQSSWNR